MKVLLVEPPFHAFVQYNRWYYPTALAQLAAVAHEARHEVMIYDADKYFYKDPATQKRKVLMERQHLYYEQVDDFDHDIWKHFRDTLRSFKPDVVGVSVYTCKLRSSLNVLRICHDVDPAIRTCVGGAHVTAVPENFSSNKHVHGVFMGWADATFPRWLAEGCPKGVIHGDERDVDLGKIPFGRRESLMFPEFYTPDDMGMLSTSRGCVGRCIFCSNGFMTKYHINCRSDESVRSEVKDLVGKWGVKRLITTDDTYSDQPEFAKRMARVYKEFDLPWSAEGRWASINKELLEYFARNGCYYFACGLESGSDKILRLMRKGATRKLIREKAKILNDIGIKWQLCCIVGFPDETVDDMMQTRDLAMEIQPSLISLNCLCPLPGTEIYKTIPGMTPEFASSLNQQNPSYCFSSHMDLDAFKAVFGEMMNTFDKYNEEKRSGLRASAAT